jgi:carbohydrate-binding DOMON domain-containing protein
VPVLYRADVKASNPSARILADADDPKGDDVGTGKYTYPTNPNFLAGIFDIRRTTVSYDSANAYFTFRFSALANPGWHPEYGFQLTFVAIAIDEDGIRGSGSQVIPRNSGFALDSSMAFERVIYIGGGLEVADDRGTTLAIYVPSGADIADPLGDASTASIRFSVPLKFLGTPSGRWRFAILAGGQDDHGGAGLGEFRSVRSQGDEWSGGGKTRTADPNVYDVLYLQAR